MELQGRRGPRGPAAVVPCAGVHAPCEAGHNHASEALPVRRGRVPLDWAPRTTRPPRGNRRRGARGPGGATPPCLARLSRRRRRALLLANAIGCRGGPGRLGRGRILGDRSQERRADPAARPARAPGLRGVLSTGHAAAALSRRATRTSGPGVDPAGRGFPARARPVPPPAGRRMIDGRRPAPGPRQSNRRPGVMMAD